MIGAKPKLPKVMEYAIRDWYRRKREIGTMKQFARELNVPATTVLSVLQRLRRDGEV